MIKGYGLKLSILFVLLFVSVSFCQQEQWLGYGYVRQARQKWNYDTGTRHIELDELDGAEPNMPEFKDERQFFGVWEATMSEKERVKIVLDRDKKYSKHNLVYVDTDVDGDLSDEKAVRAYHVEEHGSEFGPIGIVFDTDDGPVTYHIEIEYRNWDNDNHRLYVRSACWYEGTIKVGNKEKKCVLFDRNCNGTFDDKHANYRRADKIRVGETTDIASTIVGNYLDVDGKLYRPEIARDGAYIILTEAKDVVFGKVQVPDNVTEFAIGGKNGLFDIDLENGVGQVPVGKYMVHQWIIEAEDDKNDKWQLIGSSFRNNTLFDVNETKAAELDIGEPVLCDLEVRERGKREHIFVHSLKGRMDENITLNCNGRRASAPKIQIKNEEGSYLKTFNLEYG